MLFKDLHEQSIYSMFITLPKKKKNQKKINEEHPSPVGEELHHSVGESVIVQ